MQALQNESKKIPMTDDEINIALAEARGTHKVSYELRSWNPGQMEAEEVTVITDRNGRSCYIWTETVSARSSDIGFESIPDHLNGIEALGHIAEVEKVLDHDQRMEYASRLGKVRFGEPTFSDLWDCAHATARQRAEELLRTLGKWKESAP